MEGGCYRKLKRIGEDLPSGGEGGIGGDLSSGGGLEKTCLLKGSGWKRPVFWRREVEKTCLWRGPGKDLCSSGPSLPVFLRTELKNRRPDEFLVCGVASFQGTNPSNKCEIVVDSR